MRQQERARPLQRIVGPLEEFMKLEAAGGIVLLACAGVALIWANSPWSAGYDALWHTHARVGIAGFALDKSLLHWINDGLMVVFFFVVGLEIKREVLVGELATPRKAALPVLAALGGMAVPAGIYALANAGGPWAHGWGIPMATDIAFALGILALLGPRVPVGVRVFLTALAIADDIGAVLVIALFYSHDLDWTALAVGAGVVAALFAANRLGVRHLAVYLGLGFVLWVAFVKSGVHATVAGILLALTVPATTRLDPERFLERGRRVLDEFAAAGGSGDTVMTNERRLAAVQALEDDCERVETPLQRIEHALHPWVTFLIMPVFALANAGVRVVGSGDWSAAPAVVLGVLGGLLLGKPIGVLLFSWLGVKLSLADLPAGSTWRHVAGAGALAGIGFTMALFIASLAFGGSAQLDSAKVGILAASALAATAGWLVLRRAPAPRT